MHYVILSVTEDTQNKTNIFILYKTFQNITILLFSVQGIPQEIIFLFRMRHSKQTYLFFYSVVSNIFLMILV